MRIFINNVDSFVGKALCADLRQVLNVDNRILGTVTDEAAEVDGELMEVMGVKRVVSRANRSEYLRSVLSSTLIVYDLHSASLQDVEEVIKHLKLASLDHDTVFVLVSSVSVWARTKKDYVPVEKGDDEEEEEEPEAAEGDEAAAQPKVVKMRPVVLKDTDLDRRIPSPAYESWKYLESMALALGSRDKLRPHVIGSGILYGNGERTFNELFKAAWLTQPKHIIVAPCDNYMPCVHVRDVARLVRLIAQDASIGRYLIAVDKSRLTQTDIVQGIVNKISNKREVPIVESHEEALCDARHKERFLLDLIMQPSAPMRSNDFPWWCKKGLVANLELVADEFCRWRNLRPIKMVVVGPPGSGAEHLGSFVARTYLHDDPPHLTFNQIVADAALEATESAAVLRRKLEKLARKPPGTKLPLKLRTKLVKQRLMSNVCKYRGYVLEGYPESYEEAEALFSERIYQEGEEPPEEEEEVEEDEEEEGEAPPPPPEEDEDEDLGDPALRRKVASNVAPEFVVELSSSEECCKQRLFSGMATGPSSDAEFVQRTYEYRQANLAEDGSAGTADFFKEVAGLKVLHVDVDASSEAEMCQSMRVYMESKGQFFNYLRSEAEILAERELQVAQLERERDERRDQEQEMLKASEREKWDRRAAGEVARLHKIREGEAKALEEEALPLRQYLMINVVPTLSEGLMEVCKVTPDDPIEYLAEYLFAHAQDIAPMLQEAHRRD